MCVPSKEPVKLASGSHPSHVKLDNGDIKRTCSSNMDGLRGVINAHLTMTYEKEAYFAGIMQIDHFL